MNTKTAVGWIMLSLSACLTVVSVLALDTLALTSSVLLLALSGIYLDEVHLHKRWEGARYKD